MHSQSVASVEVEQNTPRHVPCHTSVSSHSQSYLKCRRENLVVPSRSTRLISLPGFTLRPEL